MKKLFCVLTLVSAVLTGVFANDEKVRLDIVAGDKISSNIITTANTANVGIRIGLNDNRIGILAGGMMRDAFATADIPSFPTDFYWSLNPYLGVELWNFEILGGLDVVNDSGVSPYAAVGYNVDLIKPTDGFSDRLSLKIGFEYYFDQFSGKYGSRKGTEAAGLSAFGIDLLSVFIPKFCVGVQYSIGWGF